MIFADDIMAGVGGISDIGGMIKSFASKLARAERFVLDRQVIEAAKQLAKSNPRSLVSALPLCRAPYATTWFEWTDATGKAGCLVESDDEGRQGVMTFASAESLNDAGKPVPIQGGLIIGVVTVVRPFHATLNPTSYWACLVPPRARMLLAWNIDADKRF